MNAWKVNPLRGDRCAKQNKVLGEQGNGKRETGKKRGEKREVTRPLGNSRREAGVTRLGYRKLGQRTVHCALRTTLLSFFSEWKLYWLTSRDAGSSFHYHVSRPASRRLMDRILSDLDRSPFATRCIICIWLFFTPRTLLTHMLSLLYFTINYLNYLLLYLRTIIHPSLVNTAWSMISVWRRVTLYFKSYVESCFRYRMVYYR